MNVLLMKGFFIEWQASRDDQLEPFLVQMTLNNHGKPLYVHKCHPSDEFKI